LNSGISPVKRSTEATPPCCRSTCTLCHSISIQTRFRTKLGRGFRPYNAPEMRVMSTWNMFPRSTHRFWKRPRLSRHFHGQSFCTDAFVYWARGGAFVQGLQIRSLAAAQSTACPHGCAFRTSADPREEFTHSTFLGNLQRPISVAMPAGGAVPRKARYHTAMCCMPRILRKTSKILLCWRRCACRRRPGNDDRQYRFQGSSRILTVFWALDGSSNRIATLTLPRAVVCIERISHSEVPGLQVVAGFVGARCATARL
jgi:hypothetical protein